LTYDESKSQAKGQVVVTGKVATFAVARWKKRIRDWGEMYGRHAASCLAKENCVRLNFYSKIVCTVLIQFEPPGPLVRTVWQL
jgi:hypothetical protein